MTRAKPTSTKTPTLHVAKTTGRPDEALHELVALYRAMTGREPTEVEVKAAMASMQPAGRRPRH